MQTTTSSLTAAITSPHRIVGHVIEVDWDDDGYGGQGTLDDISTRVQGVRATQALTTNLPEQVRVVSGAAVAQCDVALGAGNFFGAPALVSLRSYTTSLSATGVAATGLSIAKPAGAQPGDVLLLALTLYDHDVVAGSKDTGGMGVVQPNVMWGYVAKDRESDGSHFYSTLLLTRRVYANDPAAYTFILTTTSAYEAVLLCVGNANIMGIHGFTHTARDLTTATFSTIAGRPITTTLDGCTIINIYQTIASTAAPTWTFAAGETTVLNQVTASSPSRVVMGVSQRANVAASTYTAGATVNQAGTPLIASVGTVWSISFAPQVAGSDRQNALWTYSDLNRSGPLAGKQRDARPFRWGTAFATAAGVETVPVFTGFTLGTSSDRNNGTVTLTGLDNRELFRDKPIISPLVSEWPRPLPGESLPYMPGLESTQVVSYILGKYKNDTRIGFYAAPPARYGTSCYIPCHGSLAPFIGAATYAYTQRASGVRRAVQFDWGPFVGATEKAPKNGNISGYFGVLQTNRFFTTGGSGGTKGRVEFYARRDVPGPSIIDFTAINLDPTTYARVRLNVSNEMELTISISGAAGTITGPSIPTDGAWHAYGCHWDTVAGTVMFRVDDVSTPNTYVPMTGAIASGFTEASLQVTDRGQIAEVHFCGGVPTADSNSYVKPSTPWVWENFTPTAFIDRTQNRLIASVYDPTGQDEWDVLNAIAEAEYAAIYFDALGYPHYRTGLANTTVVGRSIVRAVTTTNAITSIDYVANITQIANDITISYTEPELHLDDVIYSPTSPISIPAKSAIMITFRTPGQLMLNELINANIGNGNTSADGTGTVLSLTQFYASDIVAAADGFSVTVTIVNMYTERAWLVDTSGNSTVSLTGSYIKSGSAGGAVNYTDVNSIERHKAQPLQIGAVTWRQSEGTASSLAVRLLSELSEIIPVLKNIKIVGDPRLQIGDRITITDLTSLGLNDAYRVSGMSSTVDSGGAYTCTLSARGTRNVAFWNQNKWNDGTVWGA